METEELTKLVDGIYKNILDKFNPGARQMISAGKAYLKALHGAGAASRSYVDAISKLAKQAQQGTWGGSSDIGTSLMKIVEVYKEIQEQQMNIMKAFYVDLLVPLETNLEKDTKVIQSEQKRFLQQHKQRSDTYSKAAAMMKKQRKKSRGSTKTGLAMDKELKVSSPNMQVLEEEKSKLDAFCEQSLKNAITQERRRYGFVLERHCSLAKHYLSYHSLSMAAYQQNIEKWSEVAKTREYLPETVENIFSNRIRQISVWQDEDLYSNPRSPLIDDDRISVSSQLRKTKSMDASCIDIRSIEEAGSPVTTLSRAKSEYNLNSSTNSPLLETPTRRPKSIAVPPPPQWETQLARSLYAYLSSGENQLSFLEGDLIALIGDRTKGWQFGENLRTQCSGWFPLAYTEVLDEQSFSPTDAGKFSGSHMNPSTSTNTGNSLGLVGFSSSTGNNVSVENYNPRMFGDTLHLHRPSANTKQIRHAVISHNIPPPTLPAPVPTSYHKTGISQSHSIAFSTENNSDTSAFQSLYPQTAKKSSASAFNFAGPFGSPFSTHPQSSRNDRPAGVAAHPLHLQSKGGKVGGPGGNISLHSSNDSGFSNDPPPQPEIDYSDDESIQGQTKLAGRNSKRHRLNNDNNNNRKKSPLIRSSNSSSNLVDKRYYVSDDQETLSNINPDRKGLVKRTKSFWKFGKSSDTEILEGMSLWKHKDLVDVKSKNALNSKMKKSEPIKPKKSSRDTSNDSDKTLSAKHYDENEHDKVRKTREKIRSKPSFNEKQKPSLSPGKESVEDNENYEDDYDKSTIRNSEDQFYEDSGDGLMLRTVNRKDILQRYTNDSTGSDSESESEITSDDPYDCILVDDQTQKVRKRFPNVAAIGKKLQKLSKTAQYSPHRSENNKIHSHHTITETSSNTNTRGERHKGEEKYNSEMENDNVIIQYRDKIHSFKSFGVESQNRENGENERNDNDRYYPQARKRMNDSNAQDKRRHYPESNNTGNERRTRQNYDSINSEVDNGENRTAQTYSRNNSELKENLKYYPERRGESTVDQFSDSHDGRQLLPRTKLTKTNSNSSNFRQDKGTNLTEYGETLKRIKNNPKGGSKYEDTSSHAGNMYGPWYDLWGLDSSNRN